MLVHFAAPVPPSWPLMSTWSAWPLTTPLATTPTPFSLTSFTEMLGGGREQGGQVWGQPASQLLAASAESHKTTPAPAVGRALQRGTAASPRGGVG